MVDQLDRLGRDLVNDLDEIAASIPQAPRGLGILRQVMALLPPPLGASLQPSFPADELTPPEQAVDTMAGPSSGTISGASIMPGTIGTPQIAAGAITMAAMRTGVRPIQIVDVLPVLPDPAYPPAAPGTEGSIVLLTTDGKLYRNVGDVWTAEVPAVDITGLVETIREEAIEDVNPLPALPDADYPLGRVVYLTTDGKLYRNVADVWTATVPGADVVGAVALATNAVTAALALVADLANEVAAIDITGQIQEAQIADDAVTTAKIAADAVTAGEIAANAVGTTELDALAVTGAKIAAATITGGKIAANTITAANITALTITAAEIAAGTITGGKIAANTITAANIQALTITAAEIAAATITGAKIAANTITAGNIQALTITAAEIAAATITGAKIAANTITAANITALTITAAEIAANAITTVKLDALAVTAAKIAAHTITANEIQALTITAAEIAAATITGGKIAANTITASNIAADTITAGEIAAGAIGTSELVVGATFTGIVQNAAVGATIVINASGIQILNGAMVIQDENGSSQMTATGFTGSWADFIALGIYNARFLAGVVGTVGLGRTSALPYWTVANAAGTPTLTFLAADAGIRFTFAAINTTKKITSDPRPMAGANGYEYGVRFSWRRDAGSLKVRVYYETSPTSSFAFTVGSATQDLTIAAGATGSDTVRGIDSINDKWCRLVIEISELVSHDADNKVEITEAWLVGSPNTLGTVSVGDLTTPNLFVDAGSSPAVQITGNLLVANELHLGSPTAEGVIYTSGNSITLEGEGFVNFANIWLAADRVNIYEQLSLGFTSGQQPAAAGDLEYDDVLRSLAIHDGVQAKRVTPVGWADSAGPPGFNHTSLFDTSRTLAAVAAGLGGASAGLVIVPTAMKLHSFQVWNRDVASARTCEIRLYLERTGSATVDYVAGSAATLSFTPTVASARTAVLTGGDIIIPPGVYWIIVRNTSTTQTFALGISAAATELGSLQSIHRITASIAALGATQNIVTSWTAANTAQGSILRGTLLGTSF